ncbi:hypothetical protein Droror1_Dr00027340 [Drosera rotundifolia]
MPDLPRASSSSSSKRPTPRQISASKSSNRTLQHVIQRKTSEASSPPCSITFPYRLSKLIATFLVSAHATQQTLEGKMLDLGKLGVRERMNWWLARSGSGLVSFGKGEREFGNVSSRYDLSQLTRSVREGW